VSFLSQEYFSGPKGERIRIPGGIQLHRVDTTQFKGDLARRLAVRPEDPGAFHLHANEGTMLESYAREMVAEIWNPEKMLWDNPKSRPNHAWDCEYLLWALYWMQGVKRLKRPEERKAAAPRPKPAPARSGLSALDRLAALRR
jgi:phage terminase large subunit GpA-like protein